MTEFLRLDMGPMSFIPVFHPTIEAARGALYLGNIVNAIAWSRLAQEILVRAELH